MSIFPPNIPESVANMEHGISVDAVIAGIATTVGIDPSFVVGLLPQQVVEVEGYDKRFRLKEGF